MKNKKEIIKLFYKKLKNLLKKNKFYFKDDSSRITYL